MPNGSDDTTAPFRRGKPKVAQPFALTDLRRAELVILAKLSLFMEPFLPRVGMDEVNKFLRQLNDREIFISSEDYVY